MEKMQSISKSQARKIILHAAGLSRKAQFGKGIDAVYQLIDHLGFVQLDTNYVVERAHHQVMWSRIPDYELSWLSELQEDGKIFEFFISDAGFIPMHDFRFSLPVKAAFALNRKPIAPTAQQLQRQVLDRIEREGPLMVGDFENDRVEASSGWWDWRPAKVALERLYLDGHLMISRTSKFQKRYDLPLNLVPIDTPQDMPGPEEFAVYVIKRTLKALGIASVKEMAWRARHVKGHLIKQELARLLANGEVLSIAVDGVKSQLYMLANQEQNPVLSGDAFILSPFDVLNVFRHRLRDFFDFGYQIECFVPAPKRKYGYFSLPILLGETFIARMDSKADRKNKVLIVHNLHFESVTLDDESLYKFAEVLKSFVLFNQCRDIQLLKSNRTDYLDKIKNMLE